MPCVLYWTNYRCLKQRYPEHIIYKYNEPQSAYALYVLINEHEYDPINNTMTLLKHIDKTTLLIPYEQLYIQSYHRHKQLFPERLAGDHNPMYRMIYDRHITSRLTKPSDQ
jgi:hypothetical protein